MSEHRCPGRLAKPATRTAFTLMELVIAATILALLGVATLNVVGGGARGAAGATAAQVAAHLLAKAADNLVLTGYPALSRSLRSGGSRAPRRLSFNLTTFGVQGEARPPDLETLITGGYAHKGAVTIDEITPGLIRLTFLFSWQRLAAKSRVEPGGALRATRYVCDPMVGVPR